jgi:GNAT superfamily N-acetyltransferase
MDISIRDLTDADLETADAILMAAFQSKVSRLGDLHFYRKLQPDGWHLAFRQGQPVGMVGAIRYEAFAHVGLMAVHPDSQRQGVGQAIMQFLLEKLDRQVPLVTLDASRAGQPLYEKLGFLPYDETLMFEQAGEFTIPDMPSNVRSISGQDLDELAAWDAPYFGTERRKIFQALLDLHPGRAFMLRDENAQITGYLFAQKSRIGPWVMHQPQGAGALLQAALTLPFEGSAALAVPAINQAAVELLQQHGFKPVRANRHMGRAASRAPGQRGCIYAQTSLAAG